MSTKTPRNQRVGSKQVERGIMAMSTALVQSDMAWVGRILLKALLSAWRHRTIRAEPATTSVAPLPQGPFETTRREHLGDLLLWVPRAIDSYLIDELTGGYGYSHASIDTGEIDLPTRRRIMAEITVGQTVTRKYQDEYEERPYVRIPLRMAGVNVEQLVACASSKMGEQYDVWDVVTLGEIHDPAREVCSGLVADCLPEKALRQIAMAKRLGLLHRGSVSVHSGLDAPKVRAFVSPNGFAEFYGAPAGRKIRGPDTLVMPRPADTSMKRATALAVRHHGWKLAAGLMAMLAMGFVVMRRRL